MVFLDRLCIAQNDPSLKETPGEWTERIPVLPVFDPVCGGLVCWLVTELDRPQEKPKRTDRRMCRPQL